MNFGIIAAGEGSRLVAEGVAYPKPLVRLNGVPMIGRLIDIFIGNGAKMICIIVNEQMTEVREFVEKLAAESKVEIKLVVKSTPSSMHSFYEISKELKGHGRFIVTTVDTIFHPSDFSRYVKAYDEAPETVEGMMALTRYIDDEKPLYVDTDRDMNITAFLDTPNQSWDNSLKFVSGGIYGLADSAVDILGKCLDQNISRMRNYQRALIENHLNIKGYDMGKIIDVDHAGDIKKAEEFLSCTPDKE